MSPSHKSILLLIFLVLSIDISLAEDVYFSPPASAREATPPKRKTSPSSDPDIRWAQQYYTGKRLAGQADKAKPIVTVTAKKASGKSRAAKSDEAGSFISSSAENPVVASDLKEDDAAERQRVGYMSPGIDTGISNLESGLLNLRGYTTDMGSHIQKNGLKGFLYLTPELKSEGLQVGKQIGGGVRSIMQDVGKEMVPAAK